MPYILVITTHMRVSGIGAARIDEFCQDLKRFGHKITVFTEAKIPFEKPGLFRSSSNFPIYAFPTISIPKIFFNPLTVILTVLVGWYVVRKDPPEVILAAVPEGEPGIIGYMLSRIFKIPLFIDIRDIWLEPSYMKPKHIYRPIVPTRIGLTFKRVFSAIYRRCSHTIFTTETMRDFYIREYNISPEGTSIIPNGARVPAKMNISQEEVREKLGLPLDKVIISYVGVLVSYYLFSLIFETVHKLKKKLPNLLVLIVGEGSQRALCQDIVKKLHLEPFVKFYGWVKRDVASEYMLASNLGLVPMADRLDASIAVPQKIFDYMAVGVPTIVTGRSDWEISKFFKRIKAGLVCPHNSDEIANSLFDLIQDKETLRRFSRNGRRAVLEQYNREKASFEMDKIINLVLLKTRSMTEV